MDAVVQRTPNVVPPIVQSCDAVRLAAAMQILEGVVDKGGLVVAYALHIRSHNEGDIVPSVSRAYSDWEEKCMRMLSSDGCSMSCRSDTSWKLVRILRDKRGYKQMHRHSVRALRGRAKYRRDRFGS